MNPLGILLKCKFCFWGMAKILCYQPSNGPHFENPKSEGFHCPCSQGDRWWERVSDKTHVTWRSLICSLLWLLWHVTCWVQRDSSVHIEKLKGRLGGSVGRVSDFGSGHDLGVCEFKPHIGLCADSSACFGFRVSFSLCLSPTCALSLSQKYINVKKKFKKKNQQLWDLQSSLCPPAVGSHGHITNLSTPQFLNLWEAVNMKT